MVAGDAKRLVCMDKIKIEGIDIVVVLIRGFSFLLSLLRKLQKGEKV